MLHGTSQLIKVRSIDYNSVVSMGGMKIDLHALVTMVPNTNPTSANRAKNTQRSATPWRTDSEVAELHKKGYACVARTQDIELDFAKGLAALKDQQK
ncbi:BgTH12-02403 [Blumeria graminis f. sp. triticale]|uniref:BgTH12-02403 n=1 Tax=Blumeria graminis f. sp. triticale TaxID=1689686 RepID=A0A9W4GE31_BLUGR|nr:BgTH12-02403 [Blumeria graminis f. sp. triticale]